MTICNQSTHDWRERAKESQLRLIVSNVDFERQTPLEKKLGCNEPDPARATQDPYASLRADGPLSCSPEQRAGLFPDDAREVKLEAPEWVRVALGASALFACLCLFLAGAMNLPTLFTLLTGAGQ